jgi:hypothetical protein
MGSPGKPPKTTSGDFLLPDRFIAVIKEAPLITLSRRAAM